MQQTETLLTTHSLPRAVIHVDADAFFTSVEEALRPELRGRPVITGKERGIVACASYEAKARGVRRPMRVFEARRICPELVTFPSDYETYSLYSKRMFSIIRRFTPEVEEYSIDEAFADLTGLRRLYRTNYGEIARRVKTEIQKELGLTVSVGLSLSKTLAKLASKEDKPDGLTIVKGRELHEFLAEMPLERVCGFGPNTVAFLEKRGVRTVLDYVRRPASWAKKALGKIGIELWSELRGETVYEINPEEKDDYASVSKTKTFTPPSADKEFVWAELLRNIESAFIKMRRHKLRAKKICVFLRNQDFRSRGLEAELDRATSSTMEAAPLAREMFEEVFRAEKLYRLTGAVLSKIESDEGPRQFTLFDDVPKIKSFRRLDKVVDNAAGLFGKHTVHLGSTLRTKLRRRHASERGDLPSRKTDLLRGENFRQRLALPTWRVKV